MSSFFVEQMVLIFVVVCWGMVAAAFIVSTSVIFKAEFGNVCNALGKRVVAWIEGKR